MPEQGMPMPACNDGMFDLLPSDSVKDVWFENGEGRIVMNLQNNIGIDSLHVFAALDTKRGPESFSVWTSDKTVLPAVTGDPKASGWKYLALASPVDIWGNSKVVYSIVPDAKKPLNCKYIMLVSESSGHVQYYFMEFDVFERF